MPRRSFRRYLKSNLIRIIAASGLMILATVFVTAPYREGRRGASEDHAKSAAISNKSPESFWERTTADPVAAFTGVLAIFTFVLAVVSVVQIYFLTKADKTARISADAAKVAADASMLQAKLATSLEAPKLFLEKISLNDPGKPFDERLATPFFEVIIRNHGRGPAVVTEYAFVNEVKKDLDDYVWYAEAFRTYLAAGEVITAGGAYVIQPRLVDRTDKDDILAIKNGEKWLWVHGFVVYIEPLGETVTQQFCASLNVQRALAANREPYFVQGGPKQYMRKG